MKRTTLVLALIVTWLDMPVFGQAPGTPRMWNAVSLGPISAQVNWDPMPPRNERGFLIRNQLGAICGHSDAGTNSAVVTDLEPSAEWRFAVQAYAEGDSGFLYSGWSDWSNWIKTDLSPMRAPDQLSPLDGSVSISPDSAIFRWSSVPSGHGYRLQILHGDVVVVDWQRIGDTVMTVCRILVPWTDYSWRVQSMDESNVPSSWSSLWAFSTGGTTSVPASAEPYSFELHQNYPNPFNPTTEVGFKIGEVGSVSLKVFDVLGCEVATLVNEVKQPGTYSVRWNAGGLASGVYFYTLRAGEFVQTKKLMLLR